MLRVFVVLPALAAPCFAGDGYCDIGKPGNFAATRVPAGKIEPDTAGAVIYIFGTDLVLTHSAISLDGKWLGKIGKHDALAIKVNAGEHHFCAARLGLGIRAADRMKMTARAGGVYHFQVLNIGPRPLFIHLDEDQAAMQMAEAKVFVPRS